MSDYLSTVIARHTRSDAVLRPRPVTRFEPPPGAVTLSSVPGSAPAEDGAPVAVNMSQVLPRAAPRQPAARESAQEGRSIPAQLSPAEPAPAPKRTRRDPDRSSAPPDDRQQPDHAFVDRRSTRHPTPDLSPAAPETPEAPVSGLIRPARAALEPVDKTGNDVRHAPPDPGDDGPDVRAIAQALRRLLPGEPDSGSADDPDAGRAGGGAPSGTRPPAVDVLPPVVRPAPPRDAQPVETFSARGDDPATISISIGRVIVRATPLPPKQTRERPAPAIMSLEEYLRQQANGGSRE